MDIHQVFQEANYYKEMMINGERCELDRGARRSLQPETVDMLGSKSRGGVSGGR